MAVVVSQKNSVGIELSNVTYQIRSILFDGVMKYWVVVRGRDTSPNNVHCCAMTYLIKALLPYMQLSLLLHERDILEAFRKMLHAGFQYPLKALLYNAPTQFKSRVNGCHPL